MYLREPQIRALIHKHAQLENKLIVTSGGKASGALWANRDITCTISKHIGDNRISDYVNPRQRGIDAELITNVDFNKIETLLSEISYEIACIMRAIRLTRQHDTSFFNKIAIYTMMPICALLCLNIYLYIQKNSYQHIVFLSRDGYWFHKMFQILFPTIPCSYVYFSRLLMSNPEQRDKFISNMNKISGKKLFIDLHGTGTTFNRIIDRIDNAALLLCFSWTNFYPAKPNNLLLLSSKDSWLGKYIEDMFFAPHGSIDALGNVADPEYDIGYSKPYMESMMLFSTYYNTYSKYVDVPKNIRVDNIPRCTKDILLDEPVDIHLLGTYIAHVDNHNVQYKHFNAVYYSQIGQDKFYIENIIKFKCNGVFLDIGAYDGIEGSNTYFLEKNLNWKGLLVECNPNSAKLCKQNRSSVVCDKALYKESNLKIDFVIPRGKEIGGGREQLSGIKSFLREESLDCFRDSYKEHAVIQVDTININELLEENNMFIIDYMSLDVEGYELEILKQIDFKKYKILYLTVEHATVKKYQEEINSFLLSNGYRLSRHNKWDDEYELAEII